MALPSLAKEINFIKVALPSGKKIGVRGWKVKDEKELLFTLESEENIEEKKVNHIIDFLKNCTDNPKVFDDLSEQDIKKVAIEIRKLSKGDGIEYNYQCPHCQFKLFDEVKLSQAEVTKPFDLSPVVVNDRLTVTFKDLSFKKADELYDKYKDSQAKYTYHFLINSIEGVAVDGEVYTSFTEDEMISFLDDLESNDMNKLYKEFETKSSEVKLERKITCMKCRKEIDVEFGELFGFLVF